MTTHDVIDDLDGFVARETIEKRLDHVCLARLPEALFAEAVILVEGDTDRAALEGCGERAGDWLAVEEGDDVKVGGQDGLPLPRAILSLLGIPCYVVFDGDKGAADRMRKDGKSEPVISAARAAHVRKNRDLLRYLGQPEQDWPATQATGTFAVFEDTLEQELAVAWPEWDQQRGELIKSGLGFHAKNSAAYRHAAATAAVASILLAGA